MKNIISFLLVLSLMGVAQGDLLALERVGAQIIVHKRNGQQVKGELITVKQKSLLLLDSDRNLDVNLDIREIKQIELIRKDKGAVIGVSIAGSALIGGIIGYGRGIDLIRTNKVSAEDLMDAFVLQPANTAIRTTIGIVGGILVGAVVGASLSSNQIFMIKDSSNNEIDLILNKLRKKARVPDYN